MYFATATLHLRRYSVDNQYNTEYSQTQIFYNQNNKFCFPKTATRFDLVGASCVETSTNFIKTILFLQYNINNDELEKSAENMYSNTYESRG